MYKRIVVGTDGSQTASKALDTAIALAREWGARLHVVTAYSLAATGSAMGVVPVDPTYEQKWAEQVSSDSAAACPQGVDAEVHTVPGNPADALIDVANSVEADLIVVGSRGMTGLRRVLGSVPNSVAHHAPCAVLIVKTA